MNILIIERFCIPSLIEATQLWCYLSDTVFTNKYHMKSQMLFTI